MLIALLLLAGPDFEIEYESHVPPKYEAFVFLSPKCPVAKLYANRLGELADRYPQIHFQGIVTSEHDSDADVKAMQKTLRFGLRSAPELIERLGATRSPEVVLVVDDHVVYRGRIDDQYGPGTNRAKATRGDLELAIKEVLAGKTVSIPATKVAGCLINHAGQSGTDITFQDVAAIFHERCAECHRAGQVAPFSLLTYADVVAVKDTIREVVEDGRMPPWHADPRYGKFANDRSLSDNQKSLLLTWLAAGTPRGEREPTAPEFHDGWSFRPDVVRTMPEAFSVPPEGVLDYQEFVLDPGFTRDTWIQAVEVRPGNPSVVHHVNVFLRPKGAPKDTIYYNAMRDVYFTVMVPGNAATTWPAGIAKVIPAGWDIVLSIHYQPNGQLQTDQTSIGLLLADVSTIRQQTATRAMLKEDIVVPPNSVTTLTNEWTLEDDFTLFALMPHMHLRGRSMRVEADGEVLLNVPQFDFNWQHRYVLAEPKRLKKGTKIVATAEFDNTHANPNNPDPNATVRTGNQSTDEMFQLNLDVTRTAEDRLARRWQFPAALALAVISAFAYVGLRRGRS
jgi:mono/diheme cytochrome c family protein